jgi:glutamate-1-semialdehyde 2,1-aminomutase
MRQEHPRQLHERASQLLVGGVNSPVRAFKSVGGIPRFIQKGAGAYVTDADGNALVDYVCSWGALLFGHAPAFLREALEQCASMGTSFGYPTELEIEFATLVRQLAPHAEMIRCVNSGSEATAAAIRLARGATGRPKIVKCAGCYHGAVDSLLVTAGSGVATLSIPETVGIPQSIAEETLVVPFNDSEALQAIFERYGDQIAAFIVEPIAGNMGLVPPLSGYLEKARQLTRQFGALLIFDEVMTGFRVAPGGAAQLLGIIPDLVCFGKIVGGGVPVGVLAGRADVMLQLAPVGPVYQAGTLAGNPLAMRVGIATLSEIVRQGHTLYDTLDRRAQALTAALADTFAAAGVPATIQRVGSMFTVFFTQNPVRNYAEAKKCDTQLFARFFHAMLEAGVHLPPSQFECWFMGTAHDERVIEQTVEACRQAIKTLL